jgi:PKD repeat protein
MNSIQVKKYPIIIILIFLAVQAFSQPLRYTGKVFSKVDTLKEVEYAIAPWLNNPIALLSGYNIHDGESKTEIRPLLMDIFMPHGDTLSRRPAIVFMHSGAFLLGSRQADDMVALCDSFARRGYVTATIDYRLGMGASTIKLLGIIIGISIEPQNATRSVYRGIQDGRAAIRYLKKNAGIYGIDTTKIYMAGSSAGGFIALQNIYFDKDSEIPPEVLQEPSLGGLDDIGVGGYGGSANAIVSMWGAIQNPDIIGHDTTPVFLVHGTADNMVPFKKGVPLEGSIPQIPMISFTMPETYGSYYIDSVLTSEGIFHETYFVEGKKHEFYGTNTGEFPSGGPNQYWDTIIGKTSNFLFDCFRPVATFDTIINELTVNLFNRSSGIYYSAWDFGDGFSSTEKNPVHQYSQQGEYTVRLATYNRNLACDTISKTIKVSRLDNIDGLNSESITIYPNPAENRVYISGINKPFEVSVFDISGKLRLVQQKTGTEPVEVSSLKNGIYIIEIKTGNSAVYRKFVKTE